MIIEAVVVIILTRCHTVNQRGGLALLYPGPDSFLFFNAALSDKKQSYFTLHRVYLSPLLFLLKIPLLLPTSSLAPLPYIKVGLTLDWRVQNESDRRVPWDNETQDPC